MDLIVTRDAETFGALAGGFLAARPERNVLATVHGNATNGVYGSEAPVFAVGFKDGEGPGDGRRAARGEPIAAALRTPPWAMIADGFDTAEAAQGLLECWLPLDPELTGVSAQPATARAVAAAWAEQTGGRYELDFAEAIHGLTAVIPPTRPASGAARLATESDRRLLIEWERAFAVETGLAPAGADVAARRVDHRRELGWQVVWTLDDDLPVSTVGFNENVAGVQRIGPVYTPPEHRGHGYATHAVAVVSQRLLDGGAQRCILFTDLANPTSNKIYASIGFVRFADWEELRFFEA